jgi:hypothetical protein
MATAASQYGEEAEIEMIAGRRKLARAVALL